MPGQFADRRGNLFLRDENKFDNVKKKKKENIEIEEPINDFSEIVYESVKKIIENSIDFEKAFKIEISDSTAITVGAELDLEKDYKLFNLEFGIEFTIKSVISIDTDKKMEINGSIEIKLKGAFNFVELIEVDGNNVLLKYELGFTFDTKEKLIENITNIILIPIKYNSYLIYKYKNEIITANEIGKLSLGIIFPLYGIYESSKLIYNNVNERNYEYVMFEFVTLLEYLKDYKVKKTLKKIVERPNYIYPNNDKTHFQGINIYDGKVEIDESKFKINDWDIDLIYTDKEIYFDIIYLNKIKFGRINNPILETVKIQDEKIKSNKIEEFFKFFENLSNSKFIDSKGGNILNFYLKIYDGDNYNINTSLGIKDVFKIKKSNSSEKFTKYSYEFNFNLYYENLTNIKKSNYKYIKFINKEETIINVGLEYNFETSNNYNNAIGIRTELENTENKFKKKIILNFVRFNKEIDSKSVAKKSSSELKFKAIKTDKLIVEQDETIEQDEDSAISYYSVLSDELSTSFSIKARYYVVLFVKIEKTLTFNFESTEKIKINLDNIPEKLKHFEKILLKKLK